MNKKVTPDIRLSVNNLSVRFGKTQALKNISIDLPDGKITTIVGPNACGKSTLLRSLARLQLPTTGEAMLDGKPIQKQPTRKIAQKLSILPQMPTTPPGLTVFELTSRGRTPYQTPLRQWSKDDEAAVAQALSLSGMTHNADRPVDKLSGGQRQRAWIAMVLAQDTPILLLDEPTTFLDLPHQIELLTLIRKLNQDTGRTCVMVLHDLNLAARFSDHMIAIKEGELFCQGTPKVVVTPENMQKIFELGCDVIADPIHQTPHIIPH